MVKFLKSKCMQTACRKKEDVPRGVAGADALGVLSPGALLSGLMEARALDKSFIGLPNPCLEGVDAGDSATSTCEGTCMRNSRS